MKSLLVVSLLGRKKNEDNSAVKFVDVPSLATHNPKHKYADTAYLSSRMFEKHSNNMLALEKPLGLIRDRIEVAPSRFGAAIKAYRIIYKSGKVAPLRKGMRAYWDKFNKDNPSAKKAIPPGAWK